MGGGGRVHLPLNSSCKNFSLFWELMKSRKKSWNPNLLPIGEDRKPKSQDGKTLNPNLEIEKPKRNPQIKTWTSTKWEVRIQEHSPCSSDAIEEKAGHNGFVQVPYVESEKVLDGWVGGHSRSCQLRQLCSPKFQKRRPD